MNPEPEQPNVGEPPWYESASIPALLRHARRAYGTAMRAALSGGGCDDVPPNGMYVLGGLAMGGGGVPLSDLIAQLGVSKPAAAQLVDTLVLRGYLDRTADPEDRSKFSVTLTERGQAAAAAQAAARERVDAELAECVGAECVLQMRRALGVLCHLGRCVDAGE
ncbi:MAG TPA: MarR family transcriptional regulator [Terriglobales bacterium]|jgi:DNA-binding MarR family transcriptional regulator